MCVCVSACVCVCKWECLEHNSNKIKPYSQCTIFIFLTLTRPRQPLSSFLSISISPFITSVFTLITMLTNMCTQCDYFFAKKKRTRTHRNTTATTTATPSTVVNKPVKHIHTCERRKNQLCFKIDNSEWTNHLSLWALSPSFSMLPC